MELSFGEKLALVTAVLTAAATVASICVISNTRVRYAIFTGLGLGLAFVLGLLAWPLVSGGTEVARTQPSPTPAPLRGRPTPSPSPSKPTPTPARTPAAETQEAGAPEAVSLYASSTDDAPARARYCVVGDFTAESRQNTKAFDVTLTRANVNLCNFSAHGSRRIKIRVGYRGNRLGQILWSRPITLAERLDPGQTITLSDPIQISVPKVGAAALTNDNFLVELINVPADTNREMRYRLSSQGSTQIAQFKEP